MKLKKETVLELARSADRLRTWAREIRSRAARIENELIDFNFQIVLGEYNVGDMNLSSSKAMTERIIRDATNLKGEIEDFRSEYRTTAKLIKG